MRKLFGFVAAIAILAGCGGGGGTALSGRAPMTTYITDSVNDDFSQVWVNIRKIEAVDDGVSTVLFEDSVGRTMDLKTLRDASGARYACVNSSDVPTGTYESVVVTLDKSLTLVPKGSTTPQTKDFASAHDIAGQPTRSRIVLPLGSLNVLGKTNMIVDFDLATWTVGADDKVSATLRRGGGEGVEDRNRHNHEDYGGRISALAGTSPNFTFTLLRGNGRNFDVQVNAQTNIFNENGASNPVLANAQHVEVHGAFVGGILIASRIKIENETGTEDPHKLKGPGTLEGNTIKVQVRMAFGFTPDATTYTIIENASTKYLSNAGGILTRDQFLADMAGATEIEVEGTAGAGGQFTARKLKLENEDHHEAEIKGPIMAITPGGLTMTAQFWEGASLTAGQAITVNTASATMYKLGNSTVDRATFFAGVGVGTIVEAKGTLTGTTLSAIRLKDDN